MTTALIWMEKHTLLRSAITLKRGIGMTGFPAQRYNIVAGPDEVTVDGTSKTLATLGITLDEHMKRLTLISSSLLEISWARGIAAVDGTNQLPDLGMIEMDVSLEDAGVLQFVTDGVSVALSIVQEG